LYVRIWDKVSQDPKQILTNEYLAPKLKKVSLKLITRFVSLVGKPTYLILLYFVSFLFFLFRITGYYINSKLKFKNLKSIKNALLTKKKAGIIYQASKTKLSTFQKLRKNIKAKKIIEKISDLFWKIEVFFLASDKLIRKFVKIDQPSLAAKLNSFFSLVLLKLKIISIRLVLLIPRPSFRRISKVRFLIFILFSIILLFAGAAGLFWYYIFKDLPKPDELTKRDIEVSTKIYDRNGMLLYKIYDEKNRTPVRLEDIPVHIRSATLAIEDAEFYSHPGFSIKGIARSIIKNYQKGQLTGGSTITQQLVKNALLSSEKTIVRKLREITLAIEVELAYEKNQILEMYLNEVSYGSTAYGVQEAARMYFAKDVTRLSLAEAALLAGLPKSPTQYSPFGVNPEAADARKNEVLHQMKMNGFITQKQEDEAKKEDLVFADNRIDIKAPHFVIYVRGLLEEKYGKELVEKGGLEVTTTLDYKIQQLAEKVVKEEVDKLAKLNVTNAAAIVMNPNTGEILTMVGSYDYFDSENDGNVNVAVAERQPGSSIKVVNYAYALSNGFTSATIIPDTPVTFLVPDQPPYTPRNYEGGFRGNMTLRSALAESRNIPAVRVLNSYGVKNMIDMGTKMGITTWKDPSQYGLSLTLGGGEVKPIDLARVFATVANYGRRPNLIFVSKIINQSGKILEDNFCDAQKSPRLIRIASASDSAQINSTSAGPACSGEQVLDERVAYMITEILRDNEARAPSFGLNSQLVIPNHKEVAVKTGTSNNLRDNWTIGYNQNYLVLVWVGNNDNSEMARVASGVTGASPIFNKIMSALLTNSENHDWEVPGGLVQFSICPLVGTLACSGCPNRMEWFLEENKPETACKSDWFKKEDSSEPGEEKKDNEVDIKNPGSPEVVDTTKPKKKFTFPNLPFRIQR